MKEIERLKRDIVLIEKMTQKNIHMDCQSFGYFRVDDESFFGMRTLTKIVENYVYVSFEPFMRRTDSLSLVDLSLQDLLRQTKNLYDLMMELGDNKYKITMDDFAVFFNEFNKKWEELK